MSSVPPVDSGSSAAGFPPPAARGGPPQIIIQQAPPTALGKYGRFLLLALAIAVMTIVGQYASYQSYFSPPGGPQEKFHSLNETAADKIAIITVDGAILDPEGFVKKQIDRVRKDDAVRAVVLRIDSPGGSVTASDSLYHQLRDLVREEKLPMVVSMGGMCASGGYYIAMAAGAEPDVIFAEPTTWTGSIGVVIPHYDFSGLLDRIDVTDDSIASHKLKLLGSPTRKLSDAERAEQQQLLQELVDISFARFKEIVTTSRPKLKDDPTKLERATTGQVFTAQQALELGLVDKIGFIEDAVKRAAELTGRDPDALRCVKYDEPPTTLGTLLGAKSGLAPGASWDLAALLDLAAPRAYFLCSWLPALAGSAR